MNDSLYMVLRPFAYLQIEHPEKEKFDWHIPAILSACTTALFILFANVDSVFIKDGLVDKLISLLQILPGFYIAALAAIATFQKPNIDELMPDPTPSVEIMIRGEQNCIKLTRRRFLSMLFSFLAAESIILCFFMIFLLQAEFKPVIATWLDFFPVTYLKLWRGLGLATVLFFFWQIVTASLLGLYYLGDRLHQPNI